MRKLLIVILAVAISAICATLVCAQCANGACGVCELNLGRHKPIDVNVDKMPETKACTTCQPSAPDPAAMAAAAAARQQADVAVQGLGEVNRKLGPLAETVTKIEGAVAPLVKLHEDLEEAKKAGGIRGKAAGDLENLIEGNTDPKLRLVLITACVLAGVGGFVFFLIRHHQGVSAARQHADAAAKANPQLQPIADFMDRLDDRLNTLASQAPVLPLPIPGAAPLALPADLAAKIAALLASQPAPAAKPA